MLLAFNPSGTSPGQAPAPKFGTWIVEANMDNVEVFRVLSASMRDEVRVS